jgi:hypothetical protein
MVVVRIMAVQHLPNSFNAIYVSAITSIVHAVMNGPIFFATLISCLVILRIPSMIPLIPYSADVFKWIMQKRVVW